MRAKDNTKLQIGKFKVISLDEFSIKIHIAPKEFHKSYSNEISSI